MTVVVDIPCPGCGRSKPVRKVGLGSYRCVDCDHEFDHDEIELDDEPVDT